MKKRNVNNLGVRGWGITIVMFLLFMLESHTTTDILNVSVPALAAQNGWDSSLLLSVATIAGWCALVTSFFVGSFVQKIGPKKIITVCTIAFAICVFFTGSAPSVPVYIILIILTTVLSNAQLGISMFAVIANWFPTKKGVVMGFATMGMTASTVVALPIVTAIIEKSGIAMAYRILGIFALIVAILAILIVKDTPESCGISPDNDPSITPEMREQEKIRAKELLESSPWTIKKLLKTKQVWQISVMLGINMMAATAVMSQFVARFMSIGWDITQATLCLTLGSLIGLPVSYIWGIVDAKIGSAKVTRILLCISTAGMLIMIVAGKSFILGLIAALLFMCTLAGTNNMFMSYTGSVFGRYDFANANRLMYPIYNAIRFLAFAIMGLCLKIFGGYTAAYIVMLGFGIIAIIISFFAKDDLIGRS